MASDPSQPFPTSILQAAEAGLAEQLGGPVRLSQPQALSGSNRSRVVRCRILPAPLMGSGSVIIKRASAGYNGKRTGPVSRRDQLLRAAPGRQSERPQGLQPVIVPHDIANIEH
jgi:hypothetical protein